MKKFSAILMTVVISTCEACSDCPPINFKPYRNGMLHYHPDYVTVYDSGGLSFRESVVTRAVEKANKLLVKDGHTAYNSLAKEILSISMESKEYVDYLMKSRYVFIYEKPNRKNCSYAIVLALLKTKKP